MPEMTGTPDIKDCCKEEAGNLGPVIQERKDFSYRRCTVCQCRHFVLTLDPGKLGIELR